MVTWRELAAELAIDLDRAGIDDGAVDARRIVEEASGAEGAEYHGVLDQPAGERAVATLDRMAARRRQGEPLQYVLGHWSFRTLDLLVDDRVLIPRPETEVVVGFALDEIDRHGHRRVVDLGTGSGAIALSVATERPSTTVWATDRSADALDVARANLAGAGRVSARVTLAEGSWFTALPVDLAGTLDLIVTNPPYVAADDDLPSVVADWEPTGALIAGPDGLEDVTEVLQEAPRWLASGGSIVVELAPHQANRAADVAREAGFGTTRVAQDLAGRDRAVVARLAP
jgi:release factor glutamine methyltransferase